MKIATAASCQRTKYHTSRYRPQQNLVTYTHYLGSFNKSDDPQNQVRSIPHVNPSLWLAVILVILYTGLHLGGESLSKPSPEPPLHITASGITPMYKGVEINTVGLLDIL